MKKILIVISSLFTLSCAEVEVSPGDLSKLQAAIVKNIRMGKGLQEDINQHTLGIKDNKENMVSLEKKLSTEAKEREKFVKEFEKEIASLHISNAYVEGELMKMEKVIENLNSLASFLSSELERQKEIDKKLETQITHKKQESTSIAAVSTKLPVIKKPEEINMLNEYITGGKK
ncbi:MAG: hypothetical protein PHE67_04150 [Campylobacterales bacterium]|nr:hypothetical protein [Campylobacterales bacterium]